MTNITICLYSMKRLEQTKRYIDSILKIIDKNDEIIYVDYDGYDDRQSDYIKSVNDPRIKLVKVYDVNTWHPSHARNISIRQANKDIVLVCDIDIIPSAEIINECKTLQKNTFLRFKDKDVSQGEYGTCCIWRSDFYLVNGYEEAITGWGIEDDMFFHMLKANWKKQVIFKNQNFISQTQNHTVYYSFKQDKMANCMNNYFIFQELLKKCNHKSNINRNWGIARMKIFYVL